MISSEKGRRQMTIKTFFDIMEQIHWNFGMPYQWQPLETTLKGEIQ